MERCLVVAEIFSGASLRQSFRHYSIPQRLGYSIGSDQYDHYLVNMAVTAGAATVGQMEREILESDHPLILEEPCGKSGTRGHNGTAKKEASEENKELRDHNFGS